MDQKSEIEKLASEISSLLHKLEVTFWEAYIDPANHDDYEPTEYGQFYYDYQKEDNRKWLFYGSRILYYKICLFLEWKNAPMYLKMFKNKFQPIIDIEKKVTESRGPLYSDDEPSMIIHDEFREFLSSFQEFKSDYNQKLEVNKLKLILENTNSIIAKTKTTITNETSIYNPVKWFVETIFPTTRSLNKARFIKKFSTYHPDILIPEISSAVEYKFIRTGINVEKYLDQIKVDADNYEDDPEYRFFYAVVFFENKSEINPGGFKQAISEKKFPENWIVMCL